LAQGYVTYGSDSGHQIGGFGGGRGGFGAAKGGPGGDAKGGPGAFAKGPGPGPGVAKGPAGPNPNDDWALNDEAIKNLGYMQMKKTHDAAMVLVERMYGAKPKYNYYVGSSQGGREALTVA
jgi:feruloyl esterase